MLDAEVQARGTVAPVESPPKQEERQAEAEDFGPNNETLPKELQLELWDLLTSLEAGDELARRVEIREILKRRMFFKGQQYWWWNEKQGLYLPPWERPADSDDELPTFMHVTNIFQAFCVSLMSVLSQNTVPARFWPQNVKQPVDVATAKNATKVVDVIHRNNGMSNKADDATYFLWTDGFIGGYVRYVADGERFGYDQQPIMEKQETEIAPAQAVCPECQEVYALDTNFGVCQECGAELKEQPAITADIPVETGVEDIPRGQEVIDIVPALNLKRSMWADEQKDFLYLDWVTDLHKAAAKATYPHAEDGIDAGAGESGGQGSGTDIYERLARRLLYDGTAGLTRTSGSNLPDLGTFHRAWLRPRAFWQIQDKEKRGKLLELFPKGCYVAFYGDVYLESRNESMDDKWRVMHAMPGEGQVRETLGSSIVPVQEQLNDAVNQIFETGMYGVPEGFADQNVLDFEARKQQTALPAAMTPVELTANQDIRSKVMFSPAVEPSAALMNYMGQLFSPIPQFLCGALAALFGGDTGTNDTASGIAIQRDQALGRVGRVWRKLQQFWAEVDMLAVRCFAKNRSEDVDYAVLGPGNEFKNETIALDEIQGNLVAFPEVDQQYPVLQGQIRGLILNLLNSGNEIFGAVIQEPANLEYVFKQIGLTDIEVPAEDSRLKQQREIEQLLKEQPLPGPMDPQTGQPQLLPSIPPDFELDNHAVEEIEGKKWANSEAGQTARRDNPAGFENAKLHIMAHEQMNKAKQLQMAIVSKGIEGGGPAGDLGGAEDVQPPEKPAEGATA